MHHSHFKVSLFCFALSLFIVQSVIINTISASNKSTSNSSIGQRFILSLPQNTSYKNLSYWLARTRPAGIMLESNHFKYGRESIKYTINMLQNIAKELGLPKLIISVDWEGGIVSRPNESGGFNSVPAPYNLANSDKYVCASKLATGRTRCYLPGKVIGNQLHDIGANMDFAPSLDLYKEDNKILATRCFAESPEKVLDCALAFANGLQSENVCPVIKHYPGIALAKKDSHLAKISLVTQQLITQQEEFSLHKILFKQALEQGQPAIMISHALVDDGLCASQSPTTIEFCHAINPDALIITDDISMKGYSTEKIPANAAYTTLLHGFHLLIYSGTQAKQYALLEDLEEKITSDAHAQEIHERACEHVKSFKARWLENIPALPEFTLSQEKNISEYLAQRALGVESVRMDSTGLQNPAHAECWSHPSIHAEAAHSGRATSVSKHSLLSSGEGPQGERAQIYIPDLNTSDVLVLSVDLPIIRPDDAWFIHRSLKKGKLASLLKHYTPGLHARLSSWGTTQMGEFLSKHTHSYAEYILNPKDTKSCVELEKLLNSGSASKFSPIFLQTFFYGDGVWNDIQEDWLCKLKKYQNKLVVFSLGHPYEKNIVPQAQIIHLGSFHAPMVKAACQRLITQPVQTGADKLMQNPAKYLAGKRFGVLCHKASVINKQFLPDVLYDWAKNRHDGTQLMALFAPEHGIFGTQEANANVDTLKTSKWECPVFSLHGVHKAPTQKMLENIDLLIIDFQGVGVRCFTYLSTMKRVLEAVQKTGTRILILDRPNPLHALPAQGPLLNKSCESFVGLVYTPFMHGKTLGALAQEINKGIGADLSVLFCSGDGQAIDNYFYTSYIPPSPNLVSLDSVFCYPITVFIEGTNYSEGRGTFSPFEQIGAPWVNKEVLAKHLNAKHLEGVYFEPISFTPKKIPGLAESPKYQDLLCHGVFIHIYDHKNIQPTDIAYEILRELFALYPETSQWITWGKKIGIDLLVGNTSWRTQINPDIQDMPAPSLKYPSSFYKTPHDEQRFPQSDQVGISY